MWTPNPTATLFQDDAQQRALLACIGASIALHALVLFGLPGFQPSAHLESLGVLTASFVSKPAPQQASPSVERVAPKPPREREPEKPREVLAKPEPAASIAAHAAEPAPSPVPTPSAPIASTAGASRAPDAPAEPAEAFDAGLLEAYRLALIDAAKRYKRYPVQAMERGWQGRVEIRVVIGADGMIKNALVKTSSRYQILDDQALNMVRKGNPMTPIPPALRGREFSVDVPVIFELTS